MGMKLCTVTTLRAPQQETIDFVNYHLNMGIDHMYLFFDDSLDCSLEKVKGKRTTCISCDADHWKSVGCKADDNIEKRQRKNANLALNWARKAEFDWISHIDSDELIYTDRPIKKILSELSVNIAYLKLPTKEAVPECLNYTRPYQEITLFKSLPSLECQFYSNKHNGAYFDGEFFRGHIVGKSIVRIRDDIETLSLHAPELKNEGPLYLAVVDGAFLLHFDCYDFNSWRIKWERRLNGVAKSGGRENRMRQKLYFRDVQQKGEGKVMLDAFMKMHFLPPVLLDKLFEDKMLERIEIERKLFKPSSFNIRTFFGL